MSVNQLREATLCAKVTVPKLIVKSELCDALRQQEKAFFIKRLEVMTDENRLLDEQLRQGSSGLILDRFLWGTAGATLGALAVLLIAL